MLSTSKPGYALPFEVVSILLLAAMIGCIVIAAPSKPSQSKQNNYKMNGDTEINNSNKLKKVISIGEDSGGALNA